MVVIYLDIPEEVIEYVLENDTCINLDDGSLLTAIIDLCKNIKIANTSISGYINDNFSNNIDTYETTALKQLGDLILTTLKDLNLHVNGKLNYDVIEVKGNNVILLRSDLFIKKLENEFNKNT